MDTRLIVFKIPGLLRTRLNVFKKCDRLLGHILGLELEGRTLALVLPLEEDVSAQLEPEGGRGDILHQQLPLRTVLVRRHQEQRD